MAILFGYGGVTFFVLLFDLYFIESVFSNYFKEKNWTILKQITHILWILFTIGLGNYFYSIAIFPQMKGGWRPFVIFEIWTLVVGIFPVIFVTLISHNAYLRKYGKLAHDLEGQVKHNPAPLMDTPIKKVSIFNDSEKEELKLDPAQILCVESEGNYVTISWQAGDIIEKTTLRSTLKKIKLQLNDFPNIVQCHRAYIVNCEQVQKVKGNAQGYQLNLSGYADTIPVSRSYIDTFNLVFRS